MFNNELIRQESLAYTEHMINTPAKVNHKPENGNVKQTLQTETLIWRCTSCQAWWGNGRHVHDAAALMQYVTNATTSLAWDGYRGWRTITTGLMTCPQCGQVASPFLQTRPILRPARLSHYQFYREAA